MENEWNLQVELSEPVRIDKYLSQQFPEQTRTYLQNLIKEGKVLVEGKVVKANHKVCTGEHIRVEIPPLEPLEITASDLDLDIVYEDKELLVVNKPQGMVVHPAPGHAEGTLVNGILHHCKKELSGINGVARPGIVHRIDKDTSGLLIVCKTDRAHLSIARQLKEHTIVRRYEAIVHNEIAEEEGTIEGPIGRHPVHRKMMCINEKNGKPAVTHYRVLEHFRRFTHVECRLETGRTHQIRVHMASRNHPILGDPVYGPKREQFRLKGQALHARTIGFKHPITGEYMEFTSELPQYFKELLEKLRHIR
ncbi:RluA family pseudouridine synthase [Anaerotalea alkaliphila]|uniref:Pseudouridine synthase n=1 Tax=Anaerotalea alkaliphila TaxID=2662126 RepID=A0A7X5HWH3_9FIRM|nr:RluA family pseudouridine synthase [Anaerotalea alkaliphila]NDL67932.1 RluA family pseudouridine synthase [Anaerotalea alkaliphila]